MPQVQRSSDVIEQYSERAVAAGLTGLGALALGVVLWIFRGEGLLSGLSMVLMVGGVGLLLYAGYWALQVRTVTAVTITCPICKGKNALVETPASDVSCTQCHRMIPIQNGTVMPVQQVRCGYCNELNYYSDKTEILLCESCNHEIPIAKADGSSSTKKLAKGFAVQDDDRTYELILVAYSHGKTDELIACLQHMLALNRNQVKQMLTELPVVLLTGIPRRKADMLNAQIASHEGVAEIRALESRV